MIERVNRVVRMRSRNYVWCKRARMLSRGKPMKQATAKRRSKGCNEESLLRSKMCEQKPDEPRNKTRRGLCSVVVGNYRFLCESRKQKAGGEGAMLCNPQQRAIELKGRRW